MTISATREQVEEAITRFDREFRDTEEWRDWEEKRNNLYAVVVDGKRYPPKFITSIASGVGRRTFISTEARVLLEKLGFVIAPLRQGGDKVRPALEAVLDTYLALRTSKPFGVDNELWKFLSTIRQEIEQISAIKKNPALKVTWSVGQGNWATVPWIAILDSRETNSTQKGVYIVLLFRADMSGIYLTFNQGVTQPRQEFGNEASAYLKRKAKDLRPIASDLLEQGFFLDDNIDLHVGGGRAADYQVSTVAHKFYAKGAIPSDEDLFEDISALVETYDRYMREKGPTSRPEIVLDEAELTALKESFLRQMPGFEAFSESREGIAYKEGERAYKDELISLFVGGVAPEIRAVHEKGTWGITAHLVQNLLKAKLNSIGKPQNLLGWRDYDFLNRLSPDGRREFVTLLHELLYGTEVTGARIERFNAGMDALLREINVRYIPAFSRILPTFFLMIANPQSDIFVKTRLIDAAFKRLARRPGLETKLFTRDQYEDVLALARAVKQALESWGWMPRDMIDVQSFLWVALQEVPPGEVSVEADVGEPLRGEDLSGRAVYKVAPGEGAEFWDDCLSGGYICIGWDEIGDLTQYSSLEELREAFEKQGYYSTPQQVSRKAGEVWTFRQLKPGDLVVANRGLSEVLALGEVVAPGYEWRDDRSRFKNVVHVRWDTSFAQEVPRQGVWATTTVYPIPEELFRLILGEISPQEVSVVEGYQEPSFEQIVQGVIHDEGLRLDERAVRRYHLALKSRGFVILSGVSGTGKTWLTEAYANVVGAEYLLVPVAPNWSSNEDLLGYFNPLDRTYYHTEFSRFLKRAEANYRGARHAGVPPKPFHIVLDEMNLARLEYYFAKFLSKMEERQRRGEAVVELSSEETVTLTPNLYFVGTVNVDETTHSFSDKVYDRAQLIEMTSPRALLEEHLKEAPYAQLLLSIWDAMKDFAPFAYRVLDEIGNYIRKADELGVDWREALDEEFLQKVLPKIKGADVRIGPALERVHEILGEDYPLTKAKVELMLERYRQHGFTSYF